MNHNSPENDLCLDLSLSIGPPRQPTAVPLLQSVPPVPPEHQQFLQLLTSSPPPPSPPARPTSLPLSLSLPPVPIHHFVTAPGDLNLLEPRNPSGPRLPSPPAAPQPPPPLRLPPPAVAIPQIGPRDGNLLEPGNTSGSSRVHQTRRSSTAQAAEEDTVEKEIPAPYPWATTRPARVHTLTYLLARNITVISGQVQCKRCEKIYTVEYNLAEKFREVSRYIVENKELLRDRAPSVWMNPRLPSCESCQNSMKPVISERKEEINWLFLLLGQMLGCCTLEQLRHFCQHTKQHRTGAKDRVLYLTYLALCKQLDPTGPFDR